MNNRPKIKLKLTNTDKFTEIMGWLVVLGIWILTLINYSELPEVIPIHYNALGEADSFGNKLNILTLPIISTILFVGMTILNNYPHVFNYPTELTKENLLYQYTTASRMIRYLKLIIVFVFGMIVYETILHAKGNANGLGVWFLPLTLGMIFIPIICYLIVASKNNRQSAK